MKQQWWRETVAYLIGFVIVLVVLYFIIMVGAYGLGFVGVGIVMSLDFAAHGFRWLGVSDPAVGWLLLGVLMGGCIGLAQGLKRSGRQADTIKLYIGAAALACTLLFVSFLAVNTPASRALTVPTPSARPPTRETASPTPAPPKGARSGGVSLPSPPAVPLSDAAPGHNDVRQMITYAMTKGGVDHEADIAAAKRRLEVLALKRQSDPGRRKQARDTNGKGLDYIRAGQWSEAVRAF
jgi:hypothetical protein